MNIAVICPDDLSIVLFCKELVKALQNSDKNKVYVLSDCNISGENPDGYYTKIIKSWGVDQIPVKFSRFINPLKDIKYVISLYRIFKNKKIDFVVNISTKPNIYGAFAAKCAKVDKTVCSVWGMGTAFSDKKTLKSRLLKSFVELLYRISFKISDKVWFTNREDFNYFLSRGIVTPKNSIITKNYVNTEEYSSSTVDKDVLLRLWNELSLNDNKKVVIMVARMSWAKGIKEFVDSAKILHSGLPEVKFILVGPLDEGSPDSIPKSYLIENNKHNNFMWIGFRREVKELYAIADLAVLPSYYREGGFPRALTEPMAMGKPVITTNSVHCRGTVEEGKNGYLVPVKDSKALADAIAILINDDNKRKEFGRYSRLKAENEFNEKVIVPKVVKEFFG